MDNPKSDAGIVGGVAASFMGIAILLGDWANRPARALAAGVAAGFLIGEVGAE
jgi:hypothetical protein